MDASIHEFVITRPCLMLIGRMNGFQGTVILDLRPSRWLSHALLTLHAAVSAALLLAYPWCWQRNLLLFAVVLHLAWSLHAARVVPVKRLELDERDHWRVVFCDDLTLAARLVGAPWLSPLFTTLVLACADGTRTQLVLLPDMVDGHAFRRLRVRVRRALTTLS